MLFPGDRLAFGLDDALFLCLDFTGLVFDQPFMVAEHAVAVTNLGLKDHCHHDLFDQALELGIALIPQTRYCRSLVSV